MTSMNLSTNIFYACLIYITIQSFFDSYNFLQNNIVKSLKYSTDNVVAMLHL